MKIELSKDECEMIREGLLQFGGKLDDHYRLHMLNDRTSQASKVTERFRAVMSLYDKIGAESGITVNLDD